MLFGDSGVTDGQAGIPTPWGSVPSPQPMATARGDPELGYKYPNTFPSALPDKERGAQQCTEHAGSEPAETGTQVLHGTFLHPMGDSTQQVKGSTGWCLGGWEVTWGRSPQLLMGEADRAHNDFVGLVLSQPK